MHRISIYVISIIGLLFFPSNFILGQESSNIESLWKELDKKYGFDTELINGMKYYPLHSKSVGNPFLKGTNPEIGEICINKRNFKEVKLLYEINLQKIILVYTNHTGGENKIILNSEWIDTFRIESKIFIKTPFKNQKIPFVEIGFEGPISFYRGYSKEEKFKSDGNNSGYVYTNTLAINYLVNKNSLNTFKTKRQLINCFPDNYQHDIKSFIIKNKINIRKATTAELQSVFNFINTLNIQ
ncbi:MAG: hypothetical protein A2W95_14300 [Bacteroidetes bacterium GWA2_40_14]|jgi:hypothetical protein|nr:MAG: hypothetical protein A2W95_14300 [Bacteroidetes bacterium GWA2_40_14]